MLSLAAVVIGVHVASAHLPAKDYQSNTNPGVYAREGNWQAGVYRNTVRRTTVYAGYMQPVGPIDVVAGFATGYQRKAETDSHGNPTTLGFSRGAIAPIVAMTYAPKFSVAGATPRIWFMPPFKNTSAVAHLSLEWSLK